MGGEATHFWCPFSGFGGVDARFLSHIYSQGLRKGIANYSRRHQIHQMPGYSGVAISIVNCRIPRIDRILNAYCALGIT